MNISGQETDRKAADSLNGNSSKILTLAESSKICIRHHDPKTTKAIRYVHGKLQHLNQSKNKKNSRGSHPFALRSRSFCWGVYIECRKTSTTSQNRWRKRRRGTHTDNSSTEGAPYRANVLLDVADDVPKAKPPLAVTRFEVDSRCVRSVLIRVDGGLGALEDAIHVGVLLHHLVQPRVVVGILLVAHDRRHMKQGVVGVLASRDQHLTFPLTLEETSIHAEDLSQKTAGGRTGDGGGGGYAGFILTCMGRTRYIYLRPRHQCKT